MILKAIGNGSLSVEDREPEDELLAKRAFERGAGIELGGFMLADVEDVEPQDTPSEEEEKEVDVAVGEVADIFSRGDEPSRINRDGTVDTPPEMDTVTEYAVEGEKRLHLGLIISMIVVWSAIGAIVGTTLGPVLSTIGLLAMALFGLWLGEVWIPKTRMHLLGVTWVIISMKLLYGLAISMNTWGWLDQTEVGVVLLSLVAVNIVVAQRHDEDAIAAQATLVLLAIGSAAGGPYGEEGVAVMIGLGTLLLHGLAYLRHSGNLASLGIAVSYLWIGLHAISDEWVIGGIDIKPFEDSLLLFLLMFGVTGLNAMIATRFASEDNWFSAAFKGMGLGKPGLWSVSVGLGMIGALLAIAANRLETGYALAQLILLISAFGPSYLVVRGVDWKKLQPYVLYPAPVLLSIVILLARGTIDAPFAEAWTIYAVLSAILTAVTLLNHQQAVSDHVLWTGAIIAVILLTLLIPADDTQGSRALLFSQFLIWTGLAWLAIQRDSPSLAGTAILAPWLWIFLLTSNVENRLLSGDIIPINIAEWDLTIYMVLMVLIQFPLNLKLGDTGVNLAGRLVGMSELSARMRDSGMMRLWNLSFLMVLVTLLFVTSPGSLPAPGLVALMGILLIGHAVVMSQDRHQGTPRTIIIAWSIAAIVLQWRYGMGAVWMGLLGLASVIVVKWSEENARKVAAGEGLSHAALMPGKLITITLGFIAGMTMIIGLDEPVNTSLTMSEYFPMEVNGLRLAATASIATICILYLPRASSFERLLPPAMAVIAAIVTLGLAANSLEDQMTLWATVLTFIVTGAWLAAQGEIRSRMKQVSERDERLETHQARTQLRQQIEEIHNAPLKESGTHIRMVDAELIQLAEKQKKRSKRRSSVGENDLIIGDIHHKPTIVISFISVTILVGVFLAWTSSSALLPIALASFISVLFIGIARWRAEQVNLQLPDLMGIESPVAVTMAGLTLIHVAGRLGDTSVSPSDQIGSLVLLGALIILAGMSLMGRKDLGLRIPSALEGIVLLMIASKVLTSLMGVNSLITNPTQYSDATWTIPVWSLEAFLVIAVLLFEWVESQRLERGLGDHRGAAGRFGWAAMVVIISFGLAGLLACGFAIKNAIKWQQPAIPVGAAVFAPFSWYALSQWVSPIEETTAIFSIALGAIGLLVSIWSVVSDYGLWVPAGLWIGHLLIPAGAFAHYEQSTVLLMVSILLVSATSWLIGVITLRRAWRVIGAIDLVIAWMVAGVLLLGGATSAMALVMLIATAILLGLVTWMGQVYEEEIANS